MYKGLLIVLLCWSVEAAAYEKAMVSLKGTSVSVTGGGLDRSEVVIDVRLRYSPEAAALPEAIQALEQKLLFYRFLEHNRIDHRRLISADYSGATLKSVLSELLPGVAVRFDGVDEGITLLNFSASEARLEMVLQYLGEGAGVSIDYLDRGAVVSVQE